MIDIPYLKKTQEEKTLIPNNNSEYWAVCLDSGYIGPERDTPNEIRITPNKNAVTDVEKEKSA